MYSIGLLGAAYKMKKKSSVYLQIMGACGNQFFQYAFARYIQEKLGGELIIDYSLIKNQTRLWAGSNNLLADFNVKDYQYVDKSQNKKLLILRLIGHFRALFNLSTFDKRTYKLYLWCARHLTRYGIYYWDASFYPFKIYKRKNILINGYFESPKFFEAIDDKICEELTPKHPLLKQNIELYSIIQERPSVCVSIKRQDVENPDISDVYDYSIDYFYNAVKYIKEREPEAVFVIFSDNVQWCRDNFKVDGEVYYETDGNPIWEKIRLMSGCKHFIIHNSTFSWWVQHLSRRSNKIVIAPVKWMLRDDQPIDIYENNWIYMRNDGTVQETHD